MFNKKNGKNDALKAYISSKKKRRKIW